MKPLTLDQLWDALPPVEEVRPVLDLMLTRSVPDPDRSWTASGALGTVGERRVFPEDLVRSSDSIADEIRTQAADMFRKVSDALVALSAARGGDAAQAFLEVAGMEESRNRPDRAEAWARSAHRLARDARDHATTALALRRWARAARQGGRLDEALVRYREGVEISEALEDARAAAEAAVGAGNVLEDQGRWRESEAWYRRALATLERAGELRAPERWHALLNLHIVLRSQGRLTESLEHLEAARAVAGDDPAAAAFLQNAQGQLAQVNGDPDAAAGHFRRALDAATGVGARVVIGLNLAESLLAARRHLDAAEAARRAEMEAVTAGLILRLPEVYRLLGRIASRDDNPDAFVLFERALQIIQERGLPVVERARTLQAYAESEARRGELEAAQDLRDEALGLYRELGIRHARHPWSEFFGPQDAPASNDPTEDPSKREV